MFYEYPLIKSYISGTTASGLYEARLGHEEMGGETHIFSPAYKEADFEEEIIKICDHMIFNSFAQLLKYHDRCPKGSVGIRVNPECSTQEEHAIYDPCAPGSRLGVTKANFREDLLPSLTGSIFIRCVSRMPMHWPEHLRQWKKNSGSICTRSNG